MSHAWDFLAGMIAGALLALFYVKVGFAWLRKSGKIHAHWIGAGTAGDAALRSHVGEDEYEGMSGIVDPFNPPKTEYYRPKGGYNASTAPKCSCHNAPIGFNERVVLWPIKDHPDGAYDLFCSKTLAAAYQEQGFDQ